MTYWTWNSSSYPSLRQANSLQCLSKLPSSPNLPLLSPPFLHSIPPLLLWACKKRDTCDTFPDIFLLALISCGTDGARTSYHFPIRWRRSAATSIKKWETLRVLTAVCPLNWLYESQFHFPADCKLCIGWQATIDFLVLWNKNSWKCTCRCVWWKTKQHY